jgi:hypothetical protein
MDVEVVLIPDQLHLGPIWQPSQEHWPRQKQLNHTRYRITSIRGAQTSREIDYSAALASNTVKGYVHVGGTEE